MGVVAVPDGMAGALVVSAAASRNLEADAAGAEYGTLVLSALWADMDPHTLMFHLGEMCLISDEPPSQSHWRDLP